MIRIAFSGPPWILRMRVDGRLRCPSGEMKPEAMARLGSPPGEMLTWMMVPCTKSSFSRDERDERDELLFIAFIRVHPWPS